VRKLPKKKRKTYWTPQTKVRGIADGARHIRPRLRPFQPDFLSPKP
jgi:hypothetical protein